MNLIEMLLGSMTSDSSVDALAKKTGGSNKQMYALIIAAIPILIKFLTKNAKKEEGASSLLSALGQHTKKTSAAAQIADADEEDGVKILAHILGDNQGKMVVTNSYKGAAGIGTAGGPGANYKRSLPFFLNKKRNVFRVMLAVRVNGYGIGVTILQGPSEGGFKGCALAKVFGMGNDVDILETC